MVVLRTTKEKDMVFNVVLQTQKDKWKVVQMSQFPIHFLAQTKKVESLFLWLVLFIYSNKKFLQLCDGLAFF